MFISLIIAAAKALSIISLVAMLIILTACGAWRVVYYGFGCRHNPIGKTAMLTAAALWLVSAAIINLL